MQIYLPPRSAHPFNDDRLESRFSDDFLPSALESDLPFLPSDHRSHSVGHQLSTRSDESTVA